MALPKIFFFISDDSPGYQAVMALAEDGTGLDAHMSSSREFARKDIGCGGINHPKHKKYIAHYPSGFQIVDLIDATQEELDANSELQIALRRNRMTADTLEGENESDSDAG